MLEGILLPELSDLVSRCREMAAVDENSTCQANTCNFCGGTGWIFTDRNTVKQCNCVEVANELQRMQKSGLMDMINEKTFESYQANSDWQKRGLQIAREWVEAIKSGKRPWLFFGGAVGSGKTHLCTAACGELLKNGIAVRYMLWPEVSRELKASVNEPEYFQELIYPLKKVDVLYIDDLFKVKREAVARISDAVTPADVKVAFELIDARYRAKKPTVISSEWMLDELIDMDEGTFSRLSHLSDGYRVQIARDTSKNWRLKRA